MTAVLLCVLAVLSDSLQAATTLIPTGATWRYLDNGSDQGTTWRNPGFNDSAWTSGAAELGYGDGDEATVVSYGPNSGAKYITTYFRRAFTVSDAAAVVGLDLSLLCDDGAVVYLNGVEVLRRNMPSGTVTYATYASSALGTPAETTFVQGSISSSALVSGVNSLAVEVHQANATSSDISFDLQLSAREGVSVTRGPYLQMGTPSSLIIRWRTDVATDSTVRYGTDPLNLNISVNDPTVTTEHQLTLSGLAANTQYFYSVGSSASALAGGDDFVFYTPPSPGTAQPIRVWVLGDSGTADSNAAAVRDAYYSFADTRYTDLLLMLGDNAYNTGTDLEYQAAVFNMYPGLLRQTVLWPTIGNHDTGGSVNPSSDLPYFNMFTLPTSGQAGGLASGTEKYYAFDFGNVHFVCLDSMSSDRSVGGPMLTWLASDLAANAQTWLIAFWHHPPYSKGSHNSDTETPLVEMRQNALPILEDYGVDLVLCGHSHSYERSFLIDSHYGSSTEISASNFKDDGSGRDSAAYRKPAAGMVSHQGAVYAVAGSSGKTSGGSLNHPAMFISLNELGSMVLDFDGDRLDARFLNHTGLVRDYFTIVKSGLANERPIVLITAPIENESFAAPANVAITVDASDTDGTISEVRFFVDGSELGSDSSAPYGMTWSATVAGTHVLTAEAVDNLGATSTSAPVTITVSVSAPLAPGGLTGNAVSSSQVDLIWVDHADNEDGFSLERSMDGVTFGEVARTGPDTPAYSDTGLQPNLIYTYRVRAYNSGGLSAYSESAGIRVLGAPSGLSAKGASKSQIDLKWSDDSVGEEGFRIERATGRDDFVLLTTVGQGTTSYSDSAVAANTGYSYRIQAFNGNSVSSYSNSSNARTKPK